MNLLQESLYWITSGLLIPCIVFLLFMLIQSLMAVGQYFSKRGRLNTGVEQLTSWSQQTNVLSQPLPENLKQLSFYPTLAKVLASKDTATSRLLISHFETDSDKQLSRFSNLAKLGPITGLVGTLIPMGPALQGLAAGDIAQLAQQMQIAFTTTVIGLIIGAVGFTLYQIYKRHIFKGLAILDFVLEKQELRDEK